MGGDWPFASVGTPASIVGDRDMHTTRRQTLGMLGSAIAAPYVLRSEEARADNIVPGTEIDIESNSGNGCTGQTAFPFAFEGTRGIVVAAIDNNYPNAPEAFIRYLNMSGSPLTDNIPIVDPTGTVSDGTPGLGIACYWNPKTKRVENFVVSESLDSVGTSFSIDIHYVPVDPAGNVLGNLEKVNTFRQGAQVLPVVVDFGNGRATILWRSEGSTLGSARVRGVFTNTLAEPITPDKKLFPGQGDQYLHSTCPLNGFPSLPAFPSVCAFDRDVNGKSKTFLAVANRNVLWGDYFYVEPQNNFASGWGLTSVEAGPESRLYAASFGGAPIGSAPQSNVGTPRADLEFRLRLYIFDAALKLIKKRVLGTSNIDVTTRHRPWIVVLNDGRIVIVTEGLSGAVQTVNAWLLNKNGKLLAGPVVVHTAFKPLRVCALTKMPNNRVWVFWTDDVLTIPSSRTFHGRQMRFSVG
jgi:hypothetical protein